MKKLFIEIVEFPLADLVPQTCCAVTERRYVATRRRRKAESDSSSRET